MLLRIVVLFSSVQNDALHIACLNVKCLLSKCCRCRKKITNILLVYIAGISSFAWCRLCDYSPLAGRTWHLCFSTVTLISVRSVCAAVSVILPSLMAMSF